MWDGISMIHYSSKLTFNVLDSYSGIDSLSGVNDIK